MRSRRLNSILIGLIFCQFALAVDYLDLDEYRGYVYEEPEFDHPIKEFFKKGWSSFKSGVNETVVTENVSTDQFWYTLRQSLEDGTFYNRVANIQLPKSKTGSDLFLQTVYAGVKKVPVRYSSVLPNGDSVVLSGKMFLPKNKRVKNIILASHYTICSTFEAPSHANSIEGIFATKDYIVLMADYIGYGISDSITHPYLHLKSTTSATIDLLKAAIPYLQSEEYIFDQTLILVGYSQGGAATLALQKTLEEDYSDEYEIKQVFAGAGPYDLKGTFDFYIADSTTDIPCSLPMLILGLNYGENLGLHREDFFQPLLMEKCPVLIESKRKMMHEVNAELGHDMNALLKPVIFHPDEYPNTILYDAVRRNSILDWTPKTDLFMFHSSQDNMVPFLNSEHIKAEFDSQDLNNIEYDFGEYGNHMNAAVTFFEKVYKKL